MYNNRNRLLLLQLGIMFFVVYKETDLLKFLRNVEGQVMGSVPYLVCIIICKLSECTKVWIVI